MSVADRLIRDVDAKIENWNERSSFTLKGVKNLSRSDMETLKLYARTYNQYGGNLSGLMKPRGDIAEVLIAYGLIDRTEY